MEKEFDFNRIGKRMPYNVPDGFFDKFEENVMQDVKAETAQPKSRKKARTVKIAVRTTLAVAAAIAFFFVVQPLLSKSNVDDFESVELAFNNLSTDDQDFLITVYEEDEFINVLTNTEDYE